MLTMIHSEMLFVPPIHQPIVAPPAVRVEMPSIATRPRMRPVAASWRRLGRFPCGLSHGVSESRKQLFYPRPRTLSSREHGACWNRIHRLQQLRRRRAM